MRERESARERRDASIARHLLGADTWRRRSVALIINWSICMFGAKKLSAKSSLLSVSTNGLPSML